VRRANRYNTSTSTTSPVRPRSSAHERQRVCNDCLDELHRNPGLCRLLGIDNAGDIRHPWNLSRFLDVLSQEPHLSALRAIFDDLAQRLGLTVVDLGRDIAGDAPALSGRPKAEATAVAAEVKQGLPQRRALQRHQGVRADVADPL
jgi:hypothetical protein